jgi:hypothetical protein
MKRVIHVAGTGAQPAWRMMICAGLVLLFVAGCATSEVAQPKPYPSQFTTFALAPLPREGPLSDPSAAHRLAGPVEHALTRALTKKGYTEADPDTADFLVTLQAEFSRDPFCEASERRRLTIEVLDRRTREQMWSGAKGRSTTQTATPTEIAMIINLILEPFPERMVEQVN